MNILNRINRLLIEQEEEVPKFEIESSDVLFEKMADFILGLDPEKLSDSQIKTVISIIEDLETPIEEEVKAKKETISKKQYADKYYRKNKEKVKQKKIELERSIEGKIRNKKEPIMAKGRKTPTGRHKVEYNT